jgi:hypothetical protein
MNNSKIFISLCREYEWYWNCIQEDLMKPVDYDSAEENLEHILKVYDLLMKNNLMNDFCEKYSDRLVNIWDQIILNSTVIHEPIPFKE